MVELKEYLLKILKNYQLEKKNKLTGNTLANFMRREGPLSISENILNREEYKIYASPGQGVWAEIPWLGIFHKDIGTSAQKGYNIVYLFRGDSKGVYISLNQGFTFYKEEFKGDKPKEKINKVSKFWIAKLNLIRERNERGFTTDPIDLNGLAKTDMPEGYELGNIYSKYYSVEDLERIDEKMLLSDLDHIKMVFAELRAMLPESYDKVNHSIISNNSIEELEEEIIDKNFDTTINKLGAVTKVDIPKNLKLNKSASPGKNISKRDHIKELKRNTNQGKQTEKIVLKIEEERLKKDPKLKAFANKIVHVSIANGDGAGYDIQSFIYDEKNKKVVEYYIEVKSTTGGIEAPFYMSENELQVANKKREFYSIYRLYKNSAGGWNYYIINNPSDKIEYRPIQYEVIPKSN